MIVDWYEQLEPAYRVMLVAAITSVSCALVGCYLVLRRMSLMGDALSHAVLPGLVLAFIFSGTLDIAPLLLGAIAIGVLTTFLTQTLHEYGRVSTDASMGVVFTSLFALGVVLIKRYVYGVHFDAACVYEGSLLQAALDPETVRIGPWELPRLLATVCIVAAINLAVILMLWKELKLSSFDPILATSMGFSAVALHYLLMAMVAVTAVASFEVVGSILVIAMIIVPGATAHLLTDRLDRMVIIACGLGVCAAIIGYRLAEYFDVEPAGSMTVVAGGLFLAAVLASPRYGLVSRLIINARTSLRILREDLLAMLYRVEEHGQGQMLTRTAAAAAVGGGWMARTALAKLIRSGDIDVTQGQLLLTERGRKSAQQLVRTHRLWEAYLVQHLGLPADHVHEPAHRIEHFVTDELRHELEESLDESERDPHGRDIPSEEQP